ncbi:hypothetical protein FKP32DRAFT_19653 [Trametes sanguinea]|nr:hypothetical protein FKP32DRAFT_19653 [Trametes sanguinea]
MPTLATIPPSTRSSLPPLSSFLLLATSLSDSLVSITSVALSFSLPRIVNRATTTSGSRMRQSSKKATSSGSCAVTSRPLVHLTSSTIDVLVLSPLTPSSQTSSIAFAFQHISLVSIPSSMSPFSNPTPLVPNTIPFPSLFPSTSPTNYPLQNLNPSSTVAVPVVVSNILSIGKTSRPKKTLGRLSPTFLPPLLFPNSSNVSIVVILVLLVPHVPCYGPKRLIRLLILYYIPLLLSRRSLPSPRPRHPRPRLPKKTVPRCPPPLLPKKTRRPLPRVLPHLLPLLRASSSAYRPRARPSPRMLPARLRLYLGAKAFAQSTRHRRRLRPVLVVSRGRSRSTIRESRPAGIARSYLSRSPSRRR